MKAVTTLCSVVFALSVGSAQAPRRPFAEHSVACVGLAALPFASQESKSTDHEPAGMDGVEVRVKSHRLSDEQIVHLEVCSPKPGSKAGPVDEFDGRRASVVRGYRTYEAGGRVFAYSFTACAVLVRGGFVLERYGAAGEIFYVDEDGDGTFERYRGAMPLTFLPAWVKALAE